MSLMTLQLDAAAKPVGVIPVKMAVSQVAEQLISGGHNITVMESDESVRFRSQYFDIPAPVIILNSARYVEVKESDLRYVSKRVMFARDEYTCQYCGLEAHPGQAWKQLTIDHVKPAHMFVTRLEATTWDNVTTACQPCNSRKGGMLPREFGLLPKNTPTTPPAYLQLCYSDELNDTQRNYIDDYYA